MKKEFSPNIFIFKSESDATKEVAKIIAKQIENKKTSYLGLSSGRTMVKIYRNLAGKKLDFSKIRTFNIDEYLDSEKSDTLRKFMEKNLFSKINLPEKNINFPSLNKKFPKVDLLILGIGRNCHIAFNEPGSTKKSKTRIIKLSEQTIKANFKNQSKNPSMAITIGISDILNAKKIILVAFGKNKSDAVHNSLKKRISSKYPASFIRLHKNVTFILDRAAASKLQKKSSA